MPSGVYTRTEQHRKALSVARLGYKMPEEQRRKIGEKSKGNQHAKGKSHPQTLETRMKISNANKGKRGNNWQGGISSLNKRIRADIEFRVWREAVFKRDDYTCRKCSVKGGRLHPHHIKNFSEYIELRFEPDNGVTLCEDHHKEFHKLNGFKNNNGKQIQDYLIKESTVSEIPGWDDLTDIMG